jgi:hypothetical protein
MSLSRWSLVLLVVILPAMIAAAQGQDNKRVVDRFDHFETGFPLEGAHETVECQQCHRAGVFRGTPRRCESCHNNVVAEGKTQLHIPTSLDCASCHTVQDWRLSRFDHTGFDSGCLRCHNNLTAPGKTPGHPITGNVCEDCHTTVHWPLLLPQPGSALNSGE